MLEKLVLLVVSMFSIATEMRLNKDHTTTHAALSEPWHAESVLNAAYYLP